jgi:hypothetical protein
MIITKDTYQRGDRVQSEKQSYQDERTRYKKQEINDRPDKVEEVNEERVILLVGIEPVVHILEGVHVMVIVT